MTRSFWTAFPILILLAVGFASPSEAQSQQPVQSQGCVNQGKDRRVFAPAICWAQRHLSWKSRHRPHFFRLGKAARTSVAVAWPPYVVYNSPKRKGQWRMFRIGFRYDRNWHGYIFPTAAWKIVNSPLEY